MSSQVSAAAAGAAAVIVGSHLPALVSSSWQLMRAFGQRTGILSSEGAPLPAPIAPVHGLTKGVPKARRYLWTDAFATCNFISIARTVAAQEKEAAAGTKGGAATSTTAAAGSTASSESQHFPQLAVTTLHHIHATLSQYRQEAEETRKGWLRSHVGEASEEHPTRAGVRIGKRLAESTAEEVASGALDDWDRDGQYFHYLTKHMHALDQCARAMRKPLYNLWARELADAAHRAFVYHSPKSGEMSIHWKMATDLSRPVVAGGGAHDALDGLITAVQLQHTAQQMEAAGVTAGKSTGAAEEKGERGEMGERGPMLEQAIADYTVIVGDTDNTRWATTDSLGIGGLLLDASRVEQLDRMRGKPLKVNGKSLLELLLSASVRSLALFQMQFDANRDASQRLAFRELGLAIGLAAVERMGEMKKAGKFSGNSAADQSLAQLIRFVPLRSHLSTYWQQPEHQRVRTYTEHEDINDVMLATSLAPEGFIDIEYMAERIKEEEALTEAAAAPKAAVEEKKEPQVARAAEPTRPPFTPAPARAQPSVSMTDLRELREAALPVDVSATLEAAARTADHALTDPSLSLARQPSWLRTLLSSLGDARVVMIGEASHGTEEFYRVRAFITQHLIMHHGFDFVAAEGDHPDVYEINKYVQMHDQEKGAHSADEAMHAFERFPLWMWRNHAVRDFVEWMRKFNRAKLEQYQQQQQQQASAEHAAAATTAAAPLPPLCGFYGLDLYSMFTSADEVIKYLSEHSEMAADAARERYAALESFRDEPQEYGIAVACGLLESQQQQVVRVLTDLVRRSAEYLRQDGYVKGDELITSKLNALVVADAEKYYRATLSGSHVSWNQRDKHMTDTLFAIMQVYSDRKREALNRAPMGAAAERALATTQKETVSQILRASALTGDQSRSVVWAHNSHLGDASATQRSDRSEFNIGQLVRERLGKEATFNVGFSTYEGTVSAARRWGGDRKTMQVRQGLADSYEQLMHEVAYRTDSSEQVMPNFMLLLRSNADAPSSAGGKLSAASKVNERVVQLLRSPARLQRAIGVQYVPATERQSHYFRALLPQQFDVLLHFDRTNFLQPLEPLTAEQRAALAERRASKRAESPGMSEDEEDSLQD